MPNCGHVRSAARLPAPFALLILLSAQNAVPKHHGRFDINVASSRIIRFPTRIIRFPTPATVNVGKLLFLLIF